jgi:ATP/maltotriose-dependent transcriptional regulator MalT
VVAGLDDRFALLVRGPRGVIARQQTLAASLEWSHDLLDEPDRVALRRLAVFAGSFSLDAARAVCGFAPLSEADVLAILGRLVDTSLVMVEERGGEARYRLLETIKQYAQGRLTAAGEAATARDRHLDHMLAFAEQGRPELGDADAWLARIDTEHGNMRVALDWGLAAESPERARRLAAALFWFWYLHGHPGEGIDYIQQALDRAPDERSSTQATLLAGLAAVAIGSRRYILVIESAQRGIEVATEVGDDRNRGRCYLLLSAIQQYLDHEVARAMLVTAREAAEKADDAFVLDRCLVMEGLLWSSGDDHDKASPSLIEGYRRCLARQDRSFTALALDWQADAAQHRGDLAEAHRLAAQGLEQARPLGDYFSVGHATSHLAHIKGLMGDIEGGQALMAPVIRSVEGAEQDVFVPRMARVLGTLALATGDFEAAIRWGEPDARFGGPMAESRVVARVLPVMAAAHRRLGHLDEAQALVDRCVAMARKVGIPHLTAEALEQGGHIALARGDTDAAEDLYHQALTERVEHGLRLDSVDSLDALGGLALQAEGHAEAARLLAAADAARAALGYPRPPVDRPAHEAAVAALRGALGDAAFAAAWGEGEALALDDAVALVRRARGTRGRPSHGWASLTPTELQVVKAVVDGLNNPEIGARLFMSRGTVKTHLSHIYAKLDIANRTELARVATPHLAD